MHFFVFAGKPHQNVRRDASDTGRKEGLGGGPSASEICAIGETPTKKDFDSATCAQIKAYLGPWPRVLESAGLKQPKETNKVKG